MARRPIVAANWKMHKTHLEAIQAVQKLSYLLAKEDTDRADVVVCPPFSALRAVQTIIEADKLPFGLGAQNVHWEDAGAFTGEVSPPMLAALRVAYVIVGHSERRQHFGETDAAVSRKLRAVFRHDMTPILCVGETDDEREAGRATDVVTRQVREDLSRIGPDEAARLVIAYEPVWAIGTGKACGPEDAGEAVRAIRDVLETMFSTDVAESVRVQYGGSVKAGNIREFMAVPEIDGALVGGASLDPEEFALIVKH
ncbi:MAG TPA: triose-phosphate isomerase [Actinomycetota bacterium]|nr:triose-phosphate isomerase [Actinomycetota bacterium]